MTESYLNRFSGIARLYGREALERFAQAHVAIVGIGGVGSWTAEALARSGVGQFTLIDLDDLCVTNINRQIHALDGTVGQAKVTVMAERLRAINPEVTVWARQEFYTEARSADLLSSAFHAVADAIDAIRPKVHLLASCHEKGIPVVTSGGAGGRIDPTAIQVTDLARTTNCALLHQVRKKLRGEHGFPSGDGKAPKFGIPAIYSTERPRYPTEDGCTSLERPENQAAGLKCDAGFGSITQVTASFGLAQAAEVLRLLAQ
ncbi:MAG: tRNA threonylcarbamoyladenosine dehydratase [Verrucomicrobiota bacterium JB023]|nr:tRNA threonylcarbamoyladenosine dehydratase [Verrucomicrobiota bacterium JB023]